MRTGKRLASIVIAALLLVVWIPGLALAADNAAVAATPQPVSNPFPYPGPAYSPVAMWIGMLALMTGLVVQLMRLTRDALRKRKQKQ